MGLLGGAELRLLVIMMSFVQNILTGSKSASRIQNGLKGSSKAMSVQTQQKEVVCMFAPSGCNCVACRMLNKRADEKLHLYNPCSFSDSVRVAGCASSSKLPPCESIV